MENQPGISLKNKPYFNDCIKWNEDGQLVICLANQVHIMTPILVGMTSKKETYSHAGLFLPPLEKKTENTIITNMEHVQTSYLNEEGFRCANWSSAGLSSSQSPFLVVVTTKHRVLIYQSPTKDALNSDWKLAEDLTNRIEHHQIKHTHPTKINPFHTLYASWSKRLIPNSLATKPTLLALSNKAGDVNIWTYTIDTGFEFATVITPHTSFVNLLDWTDWKKLNETTYMTYVVSSCTDGTVALSKVQAELLVTEKRTWIQKTEAKVVHTWFDQQPGHITLIKTTDNFNTDHEPRIQIALCKGVCLYLNSFTLDAVESEWKSVDLAHSMLGLAGGVWQGNVFTTYTMEGEGISIDIDTLAMDSQTNAVLNVKLLQKYKQQWAEEQMRVDDHIIGASDATPYVWGACDAPHHLFTAIYFSLIPNVDVRYGPESGEDSTLAFILQKERNQDIDILCKDIDAYVNDPDFIFVRSIKGLVREILQYLVDDDMSKPFYTWLEKLCEYFKQEPSSDYDDMTRTIYSEPSMIASRILVNANLELKNYSPQVFEHELKQAYTSASALIQTHYLSTILGFALNLSDQEFVGLSEQDKMVLLLLSDTAVMTGNDAMIQKSMEIYARLQDKFPDLDLYKEISYVTSAKDASIVFEPKAREKCLVCQAHVQVINSSSLAQCDAGHFWELCSMTKRVLHSPITRKCVSCGAKSLYPDEKENTLITNVILTHCSWCIHCGSALVVS
ncbi:uncharacterized protein B0P05DRAFT_591248 [Gilbertella persicaria]|uniref:uncharacterized protein n=1 Tax=Gilbertella persicaria TaxID=101096 RepID=UPI0022203AF5|nr:uncharacterized protein B0P05DRAFT_591248 [Gilbertella persicaria]KAI8057552.1 hypothetical protein B0P05DRAFT_591248 [Gilbertella persicaria]